jgi:hypothetical protein
MLTGSMKATPNFSTHERNACRCIDCEPVRHGGQGEVAAPVDPPAIFAFSLPDLPLSGAPALKHRARQCLPAGQRQHHANDGKLHARTLAPLRRALDKVRPAVSRSEV